MTKEEQRIEQIEKFSSQCYEDGEKYSAFISGAIWADNNNAQDVVNLNDLWHDAIEEPCGNDWKILCQDENGGCWVETKIDAFYVHNKWCEYCQVELLRRWAYISDLLPKGGDV